MTALYSPVAGLVPDTGMISTRDKVEEDETLISEAKMRKEPRQD